MSLCTSADGAPAARRRLNSNTIRSRAAPAPRAQGTSVRVCVARPSSTTGCSVQTRTPAPSVTTAPTQRPWGSTTNGLASRPASPWIIRRCSAGPAIAVEPAASESMIAWLVRSASERITEASSGFPSTSTGASAPSSGTCTATSTSGMPATTATLDTTSSLRAAATRSRSAVPMSSLPCDAISWSPTISRIPFEVVAHRAPPLLGLEEVEQRVAIDLAVQRGMQRWGRRNRGRLGFERQALGLPGAVDVAPRRLGGEPRLGALARLEGRPPPITYPVAAGAAGGQDQQRACDPSHLARHATLLIGGSAYLYEP